MWNSSLFQATQSFQATLDVSNYFGYSSSMIACQVYCCLVVQVRLTLYGPPGSSVHGISQTRILEWVAISCSRGSSRPRDQTCISCIDRQILYYWATREFLACQVIQINIWNECLSNPSEVNKLKMISILNFSCLQMSRTDVSIYSDINEFFVILEGNGGGRVVGMLWMGHSGRKK